MRIYSLILLFISISILIISCTPAQQASAPVPKPEAKVDIKPIEEPSIEPKQEISDDVKELIDKSKTKVKSIYYKYKGPETGNNFYEFYVRGDRIKYKPAREVQSLDQKDSFDAIFIDKIAKTAESYCEAAYCAYKGKKGDLNYNEAYISTIFDWISGLTKAIKVGEEVIDDRSTWKIDSNKGILWIDRFYGIPLKVDSSGKIYRFQQISINSVQDSDVTP